VFSLESGDVGDGGEYMSAVNDCSLNAIALIDASISGFFVQDELQQQQQSHHRIIAAVTLLRLIQRSQAAQVICA